MKISGCSKEDEIQIEDDLVTAEEQELIAEIKSSFPYWQNKSKEMVGNPQKRMKRLLKKTLKNLLFIVCATIIIGPICGQAKNIATFFNKS